MQIILSECLKSRFFLHFSHNILYKKSVHFFEKLHTMAFMTKNKISTFDNWKMWLSSLFWLEPCAGGICLRERQWQSEVLCIAHKKWGLMFPKWRIKRGETLEIGAIREIQEETWLYGFTLWERIGVVRDRKRRKKITFFEVKNVGAHSPIHDEAIMWVSLSHALKHLKHEPERKILQQYLQKIWKSED